MACHTAPRPRVSIEIERVRQGEADQVPHGLSALAAGLPVDDSRDLPSGYQEVSEPEVAVHGRTWSFACMESRVDCAKCGERPVQGWIVGEATAQDCDVAVVQVHRLPPPPRAGGEAR